MTSDTPPDAPQQPLTVAPRTGRRWPLPVFILSVTVTALTVVAFGAYTLTNRTHTEPEAADTTAQAPQPLRSRTTPDTILTAAAARLLATPPPTAAGRVTYLDVEQWATSGEGITPRQEQRWFDSGTRRSYIVTRQLPTISIDQFRPELVGHTDFTPAEVSTSEYTLPRHSLHPPIPETPAEMIKRAAEGSGGHLTAGGLVDYVASIYFDTHPTVAVRAAVLRVLATAQGITIDANARDPLDRPGVRVTAIGSYFTFSLIINPTDGMALSFTQQPRNNTLPGANTAQQHAIIVTNTRTHDWPDRGATPTPTRSGTAS